MEIWLYDHGAVRASGVVQQRTASYCNGSSSQDATTCTSYHDWCSVCCCDRSFRNTESLLGMRCVSCYATIEWCERGCLSGWKTVGTTQQFSCVGSASPHGLDRSMTTKLLLEELPDCKMGYPLSQVERMLFFPGIVNALMNWLSGQTLGYCEGQLYNYATEEYELACDGIAHGAIVYEHDLLRFLYGRPVID